MSVRSQASTVTIICRSKISMGGVFHPGAFRRPNASRCSSKRSNIDGSQPTPASRIMVGMVGKRSNTPPAIMS